MGLTVTRHARPGKDAVVLVLPDGTEMRVSVKKLGGGRVSLTFAAPMSVRIVREELIDEIERGGAA